MVSKILMFLALLILAYMVWITLNNDEICESDMLPKYSLPANQSNQPTKKTEHFYNPFKREKLPPRSESFANGIDDTTSGAKILSNEQVVSPSMPSVEQPQLVNTYPQMNSNSPANTSNINEISYASVPSTFKGSQASGETKDDVNDVYKVDGTDLLAAPLADRFYSPNSIANLNRNASSDLRGDIAISYNDTYTPFYQSSIYGEPLTVNRLGDSK